MNFTKLLFTLIPFLLFSLGHAAIVTLDWNITYVQANPDGLFERKAIGVNGMWPLSAVNVNYQDTLVIHVQNSLDVGTGIHFHGIFQNGTGYYDGPVGITQCGIPPGANLTYTVAIQQWGTYWIHSHYKGQYVDGLRTPFIVHPPQEVYNYDTDYTVILNDWYHNSVPSLLTSYLDVWNPTGIEPIPDSGMINNNAVNTTFNFVPGKTYRLRIISMAAFSMFHFYIDDHEFDIIEVDGIDVHRQTVTSISISVAQRYSVLVQAKNSTSYNYLMHADMDPVMFDHVPPTLNTNITATIIYSQAAPMFPLPPGDWTPFDDTTLVPVIAQGTAPPDISFTLTANFQVYDDAINHGAFNNIPFQFPNTPQLFTTLSMGTLATNPAVYGPNSNALVVDYLQMVELVVNNNDTGIHPFHLHAHSFQVIGRNDVPYDPSSPYTEPANPVRRDTIQVPGGGNVVLRFRADNPGVWFFHCHIEWHMEAGLALSIIEAPLQAQARLQLPQVMQDHCRVQGISPVGNAAGEGNNGTDFAGLSRGPQVIVDGFNAKAIGALTGCVIAAILGMGTVVWYSKEDKPKKM